MGVEQCWNDQTKKLEIRICDFGKDQDDTRKWVSDCREPCDDCEGRRFNCEQLRNKYLAAKEQEAWDNSLIGFVCNTAQSTWSNTVGRCLPDRTLSHERRRLEFSPQFVAL